MLIDALCVIASSFMSATSAHVPTLKSSAPARALD